MSQTTTPIHDAVPEYEVERELGRGAMGIVHLARHRHLGRSVAIKEISGSLAEDPDVRARFLTEARVLATLDHPNIVPVYDYVEHEGRCLLIMEALHGGTVWDRFTAQGLSMAASCDLVLHACAGVAHAHRNGVLHRDLKPENLLLTAGGDLKVSDFGIAKVLSGSSTLATAAGSVLGTPAYMAPEQAEGREVGPSADVYALGTILYELLSGRLPFEGDSPIALLVARVNGEPPPLQQVAPTVPSGIARVVDHAIARSTDDRIATADQFAEELRRGIEVAFGSPGTGAASPTADRVAGRATAPPTGSSPAGPAAATVLPASSLADGAAAGPERQPAPATVPPSHPAPSHPADVVAAPVVDPVVDAHADQSADPPTEPQSEPPVEDKVVRPAGHRHRSGMDGDVRRADLVDVGVVVRRPPGVGTPLLLAAVAAVLAGVLTIAAPHQPASTLDGLDGLTLSGVPVAEGGAVDVDLADPLVLIGLPPQATEATVGLDVGIATVASQEVTVAGGRLEFDAGTVGLVPAGRAELHVAARDRAGADVGRAHLALVPDRAWWQSGLGVASIVLGLFALAGVASASRPRRRGRVAPTALVGAGLAGALVVVCLATVLAATTGAMVGPAALVAPAVAGAVAGGALTVARARLARRRNRRRSRDRGPGVGRGAGRAEPRSRQRAGSR